MVLKIDDTGPTLVKTLIYANPCAYLDNVGKLAYFEEANTWVS